MDKAKRTEPPKKLCPQKISCFSPAGRLIGAGPPHSARSAACCEENASPSFCLRDSATAMWLCTFGTHRPCGPELLQSTIRAQFPAGSCTHPFARLIHILLCAPRLPPGNKNYCTTKYRCLQGVLCRFAEKFAFSMSSTPCGRVRRGARLSAARRAICLLRRKAPAGAARRQTAAGRSRLFVQRKLLRSRRVSLLRSRRVGRRVGGLAAVGRGGGRFSGHYRLRRGVGRLRRGVGRLRRGVSRLRRGAGIGRGVAAGRGRGAGCGRRPAAASAGTA